MSVDCEFWKSDGSCSLGKYGGKPSQGTCNHICKGLPVPVSSDVKPMSMKIVSIGSQEKNQLELKKNEEINKLFTAKNGVSDAIRDKIPCVPHATWCERYGLPTSEHACEICTEERGQDFEFAQHMRNVGRFYGAIDCVNRVDSGKTEEKKCCGGKTRQVPIYNCKLTGNIADCGRCRNKSL